MRLLRLPALEMAQGWSGAATGVQEGLELTSADAANSRAVTALGTCRCFCVEVPVGQGSHSVPPGLCRASAGTGLQLLTAAQLLSDLISASAGRDSKGALPVCSEVLGTQSCCQTLTCAHPLHQAGTPSSHQTLKVAASCTSSSGILHCLEHNFIPAYISEGPGQKRNPKSLHFQPHSPVYSG